MRELGVGLSAEDDNARRRALDVRQSFLVQAPAGSGKTELLVQRYLALLAQVEEPEHIVALTFTNKAAGEMRERVLKALADASDGEPVENEHEALTRTLALQALAQDARRGWSLVEHASRLKMQTFDALSTSLVRRAPLSAGLGPQPGYVEDARMFYRRAAEAALAAAPAGDRHWQALLVHLDNQVGVAVDLIAGMLASRDQWLRHVTGQPPAALRAGLMQALRAEIVDVLTATRQAFPAGAGLRIAELAALACPVLAEGDRDYATVLTAVAQSGGLPPATVDALPRWRALARFLMVKNGSHFKQSLQERDGFPAAGTAPAGPGRRERKRAMLALCTDLSGVLGLAEALATASRMPEPHVGDKAWFIVEALLVVLRQAAQHLSLVFASEGRVDFAQAGVAAVQALGDEDAPSDLLLRLDATVRHLLVDEFQDTSYAQLRLIERLTEGWAPGEDRTIFAVGDPMQSIYRFREAEVAFFVAAYDRGAIGKLPVERLRLRRNFRSQANVVEWCNRAFAGVLGEVSDAARGVVKFEPAVPHRPADQAPHPTVELCDDAVEEAARIVRRIGEAQAARSDTIAVLVRARSHLTTLLPHLRREKVPFVAVELDKLSKRQAVLDLVALTHALLQPADRAAWVAVLRAPWCGLALADLLSITEASGGRDAPLARVLDDPEAIAHLSTDGRLRLSRVMAVLRPALLARGHASVAARVRGAWLALGGPACLDDPLDLDAATLYFELVAAHDQGGDVPDWDAMLAAIDSLLASPAVIPGGAVQVMTMHKAKGLEFDTVILAGLASWGKSDDPSLLLWRRRDAGLLIAPGKARGGEAEPLYAYLETLDRQGSDAELGRLLYVACTRARTRLHLVAAPGRKIDADTGETRWKTPPTLSSLAKLWPAIQSHVAPPAPGAAPASIPTAEAPPLMRWPLDTRVDVPDDGIVASASVAQHDANAPAFDWARETTRWIGTIAHRLLARIAKEGPDAWPPERIAAFAPRVRADLASAGFTAEELPAATARALEAIRRTLVDPRGRWLFDPGHEDARSEWPVSGLDGGAIVRVVLDRTFVDDGVRWIVDFKTGMHEGGAVDAFLDREVERYRDQLARYARLVAGLDPRPVRLALYYPLIEHGFREVG